MSEEKMAAIFWVAVFFVSGPCLILLNSHVLNKLNFHYPVFFSSLGVWGSALLGQLLVRSGLCPLGPDSQPPSYDMYRKSIAPLSLLTAVAIAVGNAVYMHQSVAFTQMLKALGPTYVLALLTFFGMKSPTLPLVASVALIMFGTAVASISEMKLSWTGFFLQVTADLIDASKLVLLQRMMVNQKFTPMETVYYAFPVTSVWLVLLVLWQEPSIIKQGAFFAAHWTLMLAAIFLGFAVNFAGSAVIKYLGSLTFKLISVVRNNLLVLVAILAFNESSSLTQGLGYAVSVAGFVWYTMLEQREARYVLIASDELRDSRNKV